MNRQKLHANLEAIRRIAQLHGALALRVFGSVARGDTRTDSDLDLLADFEPRRDLLDIAGLKIDLEALLGCKVDLVEEKGLSSWLRQRILREAQPL